MERYSHIIRYWITNEKKGNLTHNIKQANTANHIKYHENGRIPFPGGDGCFRFPEIRPGPKSYVSAKKEGENTLANNKQNI